MNNSTNRSVFPDGAHRYEITNDSLVDDTPDSLPVGSVVLVREDITPRVGDLVIAKAGDSFTCKRLDKDEGGRYLKSPNVAYADYRGQFQVFGTVTESFRRYQ